MNKIIKNILVVISIAVILYAIYNFYTHNKNKIDNTDTSNHYDHSTDIKNTENAANPEDANNATNSAIKSEVTNVLKEHPEIMVDALQNYSHQKKQEAHQAIANLGKDPLNSEYDGKFGDVSAPNKISIFFSYGCSHCVDMSNTIHNVLEDRKDIFVVYKDLPMNSYAMTLSHASFVLNTIAPEKYESFHIALMNAQNNSDVQSTIKNSILSLGLSQDQQTKFEDALADKDLTDKFTSQMQGNRALSLSLGIKGTPGLIINNQLIPGSISQQDLESLLNKNDSPAATQDSASNTAPPADNTAPADSNTAPPANNTAPAAPTAPKAPADSDTAPPANNTAPAPTAPKAPADSDTAPPAK